MDVSSALRRGILSVALVFLSAAPISAQVGDNLSAYAGRNATGYLGPLVSAMGTCINAGIYRTGRIPDMGLNIAIEFPAVGLFFEDDDRYFMGTTEAGFSPETTAQVPTVVGPTDAVIVPGDGGTSFAFPGGFDISSFALVAPQIRVGSLFGTEAMARFISFKVGGSELGDVMLAGFGVRHSISRYMGPVPPVDMAVSFYWQDFKLGKNSDGGDLSETKTYSLGAQVSRQLGGVLSPYAVFSYNSYSTDVEYTSDVGGEDEEISLSFDDDYVQLTLGLELNLWILNLWGEYNIGERQSFGAGLGLAL